MDHDETESSAVQATSVYDVRTNDPRSQLVDRAGMSDADLQQIAELMSALGELRDAERALSRVSQKYMKLNETDMRALHYVILCKNSDQIATPSGIAQFLSISTASTTKLLDRLEAGGHIVREAHPTDRRALAITITPETHKAAVDTVGRQQSQRFYAAAILSPEKRDVVIGFLRDMTQRISTSEVDWAGKTR